MGRRELVLIVVFLALGVLVYQATAPSPTTGDTAPSWSEVLRNLRGRVLGARARVAVDSSLTRAIPPDVAVLDLGSLQGRVEVLGEPREDVAATLRVSLLGESEAEAAAAASRLRIDTERRGERLRLVISHPDPWRLAEGRRMADVTLRLPQRMRISLSPRGTVDVRQVGGVELDGSRGTVRLSSVSGPVSGQHRDGSIDVTGAARVDLETRRATIVIDEIAAAAEIEATDGHLVARRIGGPLTLDVRRATVEIEDLDGECQIEAEDGRIHMRGLRTALTAELRRTELTVSMARAAAVEVEAADAPVEIELPAAGVTLDLKALDGLLEVPPGLGAPRRDGGAQQLTARYRGGGPTVRVEARGGAIRVRPAR